MNYLLCNFSNFKDITCDWIWCFLISGLFSLITRYDLFNTNFRLISCNWCWFSNDLSSSNVVQGLFSFVGKLKTAHTFAALMAHCPKTLWNGWYVFSSVRGMISMLVDIYVVELNIDFYSSSGRWEEWLPPTTETSHNMGQRRHEPCDQNRIGQEKVIHSAPNIWHWNQTKFTWPVSRYRWVHQWLVFYDQGLLCYWIFLAFYCTMRPDLDKGSKWLTGKYCFTFAASWLDRCMWNVIWSNQNTVHKHNPSQCCSMMNLFHVDYEPGACCFLAIGTQVEDSRIWDRIDRYQGTDPFPR